MAITKTDFIEYSRCPRYVALEKINKEYLEADISYEDYKNNEKIKEISEIYSSMIENSDEGIIDKINVINPQLEAMLDDYKRVEEEAGKIVSQLFGGNTKYAIRTKDQEAFDFLEDGIRFLCYVDIYNEKDDIINIIEVKATTSKKYTELMGGYPKQPKYSIWHQNNNIYTLKNEIEYYPLEQEMSFKTYQKQRDKLFNRFGIGSYIYDLAVQRFIIEGEYKETKREEQLKNIHYYLAVLNENYIFDGTYLDGKPLYNKDNNGNELITLFSLDTVTQEYQLIIKEDARKIKGWLAQSDASTCPLSNACGYKKQTVCKFFKEVCGKKIPPKNSSLNYLNNAFGFVREDGTRIKGLELINEGYLDMLDIPESWINNPNHVIERECYKNHQEYINKDKIKAAIDNLEYPIYHLDFETFPGPLPRFKGEWPYIQSPFEFSLHIEHSPGICDKQKDNIIFLATTKADEREELIKCLLSNIDVNKGTLFAQNVSFEKGRIKELANIFPQYKEDLMKLYNRGFDLLWIINNKKELYQELGFNEEECSTINFYDERLSGSFSIKKTLPVFSSLSYQNLVVKNGTEAIVEYANYDKMTPEERKLKQEALKIYCQQDTWAMVEILDALRKKVQ